MQANKGAATYRLNAHVANCRSEQDHNVIDPPDMSARHIPQPAHHIEIVTKTRRQD